MIDDLFWSIADMYEAEGKDGQPYIPRKNWIPAAKTIAAADDFDYNETYADISLLFNYTVPKEVLDYIKKLCEENK